MAVLIGDTAEVRPTTKEIVIDKRQADLGPSVAGHATATELGIWLSGLESFLAVGHRPFSDTMDREPTTDATREFRLVHSTLQRCALLHARMMVADRNEKTNAGAADLRRLGSVLREATQLSESIIESGSRNVAEWSAWSGTLSHRLGSCAAFRTLIRNAESVGEQFLPENLFRSVVASEHKELALVLPRFGKILKWLSVIGEMLDKDEPLKPVLLIFARVNEQIFEMTTYINNRLERFPDQEAELFGQLDAAAYTASIELKKVYSQELAGIANLRPAPSLFARTETAYSLLNDGFQQIVAGFARMIDPKTDVFKLFPSFDKKLQQSIVLRQELWRLSKSVQAAEANPEKAQVTDLQTSLMDFLHGTSRHLFYKDTETVERFVEEILITKQNKDLVPILHRFGAYLEALFGQVNLRAVLVDHPFEKDKTTN